MSRVKTHSPRVIRLRIPQGANTTNTAAATQIDWLRNRRRLHLPNTSRSRNMKPAKTAKIEKFKYPPSAQAHPSSVARRSERPSAGHDSWNQQSRIRATDV